MGKFLSVLLLIVLSFNGVAEAAARPKKKERIFLDSSPTLKENPDNVARQKLEEEKMMLQNQLFALDDSLHRVQREREEKQKNLADAQKTLSFLIARFYLFCREGFLWLLTRGAPLTSFVHGKACLKDLVIQQEKKCLGIMQSLQATQDDEQAILQKQEEYKNLLLKLQEKREELSQQRFHQLQNLSQQQRADNSLYAMALTLPAQGKLIFLTKKDKNSSQKLKIETNYSTEVVAPTYGMVCYVGPLAKAHQVVIIDHGSGYHSILSNLESVCVTVGKNLYPGELVGKMAGYGKKRPILTFEFRGQEGSLDPLPGLRRGGLS